MAGESRRPWQISIRIKRALLHHAEVPTAVDFLMRGRGGAWSFATRGAAWPWVLREAGREELPGMLQLRWKFSSPRAGFQYPLMVVLSSGRLENMSEFVKVPRFWNSYSGIGLEGPSWVIESSCLSQASISSHLLCNLFFFLKLPAPPAILIAFFQHPPSSLFPYFTALTLRSSLIAIVTCLWWVCHPLKAALLWSDTRQALQMPCQNGRLGFAFAAPPWHLGTFTLPGALSVLPLTLCRGIYFFILILSNLLNSLF